MKKKFTVGFLGLFLLFTTNSCFKDRDDEFQASSNLEIQDFIWKAMNIWYLYKPDVQNLADDRFSTDAAYQDFLESYASPEDLFYSGLVAPFDEFSFIVDDYRDLENALQGVGLTNGMDYGLYRYPNNSDLVFGFVRYVMPGTSADQAGVERGMLFTTINGEQLRADGSGLDARSSELLRLESYTIGLATIDDADTINSTGEEISLVKEQYIENPIHIAKTLDVSGHKIGYLMYNGFTSNFDEELNTTFGNFKTEGITDLVLDLRYNGGGSVRTATDLSSMITGQFTGEVFSTEVWNPQIQEILESNDPESLINRFNAQTRNGTSINDLNLTRLYVLTTRSSASASELVINSLDPYIEVIQIGTTTRGKFQASTTFYDSEAPQFRRDGANPNHFYAIQPLILTSANANGRTGFVNGLNPEIVVNDDYRNPGVLGNPNEPLLATAIAQITSTRSPEFPNLPVDQVGEVKMFDLDYQRMYIEMD